MVQAWILIIAAVLVGIDQLTKWLVVSHLKEGPPFVLIDGVFELKYSENTGAAFGILTDHRWVFMLVTSVVLVFLIVVLMSGRFRQYKMVNISGTLILAGGVGNMIDRVLNGYVVDFLYFKLINFPIFNFADCCVVVGAVALLVFFFFFYNEEKGTAGETAAGASAAGEDTLGGDRPVEALQPENRGGDAPDGPAEKDGETDHGDDQPNLPPGTQRGAD